MTEFARVVGGLRAQGERGVRLHAYALPIETSKKGPRNDLEYPNRSGLGRRRKGSHRNNRRRPCLSRIQGLEEGASESERKIVMGKMLPIVHVSAVVMTIQAVMAIVVYLLQRFSLERVS
jgi:hypothetical protein